MGDTSCNFFGLFHGENYSRGTMYYITTAEYLDEYRGIDEDSVKAVRRYTIKFEVENDGDEDTQKVKILVAKIGNKWYYAGSE